MTDGWTHLNPDWPRYCWDADALAVQLAECHRARGALLADLRSLGVKERQAEVLRTRVSDVTGSSAIEGENLDQLLVRSSIARRLGLDTAGLPESSRYIDGVVEMSLDATQNFSAPLTHERLSGWQAALFPTGRSGTGQIITGAYRDDKQGPMQVVSGPIGRERVHFEAPGAGRVPGEMDLFLKWFEEEELDPIIKSALAHLWFVTIHPFDDGNGRVGRAILDMALSKADGSSLRPYSLASQLLKRRKEYYSQLESASRGSLNVTGWLAWFLARLCDAVNEAKEGLVMVKARHSFWTRHRDDKLNERQSRIINMLFDGFAGKLQTAKYAKIMKCSNDTALRDLSDLVIKGILIRGESRGRSASYHLAPSSIAED